VSRNSVASADAGFNTRIQYVVPAVTAIDDTHGPDPHGPPAPHQPTAAAIGDTGVTVICVIPVAGGNTANVYDNVPDDVGVYCHHTVRHDDDSPGSGVANRRSVSPESNENGNTPPSDNGVAAADMSFTGGASYWNCTRSESAVDVTGLWNRIQYVVPPVNDTVDPHGPAPHAEPTPHSPNTGPPGVSDDCTDIDTYPDGSTVDSENANVPENVGVKLHHADCVDELSDPSHVAKSRTTSPESNTTGVGPVAGITIASANMSFAGGASYENSRRADVAVEAPSRASRNRYVVPADNGAVDTDGNVPYAPPVPAHAVTGPPAVADVCAVKVTIPDGSAVDNTNRIVPDTVGVNSHHTDRAEPASKPSLVASTIDTSPVSNENGAAPPSSMTNASAIMSFATGPVTATGSGVAVAGVAPPEFDASTVTVYAPPNKPVS
jgi:hypothetical protein